MSTETKAAMEAAIAAHMAEDGGGILTGYVLKATSVSMGDDIGTVHSQWDYLDDQPIHVTLGLTEALHIDVRNWYEYGLEITPAGEEDD